METIGFQLDDVLDLAVQMETNGAEFYELAARSTPQAAARLLISGLAAMEKAHKAAFVNLKERRGIGAPAPDSEGAGFTAVLPASGREAMEAIEKDEVAAVGSTLVKDERE